MNSFQGAHKKGALFFFVSRFAVEKLSGAIIVSERKKRTIPNESISDKRKHGFTSQTLHAEA
jgi:hypothetical protein